MEEPSFWDDNTKAQKVIAQANAIKSWLLPYEDCKKRFSRD